MFKAISILVVLAMGIFILAYFYKPSELKLKDNEILLQVGMQEYSYPYSLMNKDTKNFSNLEVTQYTLNSGDEILIYEKAEVEGLYEFNSNPKEIITKLFDAKLVKTVFEKNGLGAFVLTLSNGDKMNLFVLQTDSKEMKLFYGMSDKLFSENIEKLTGKKVELKNDGISPAKPITLWSDKVNNIDGIIVSTDH
jgi:hypothetical protein